MDSTYFQSVLVLKDMRCLLASSENLPFYINSGIIWWKLHSTTSLKTEMRTVDNKFTVIVRYHRHTSSCYRVEWVITRLLLRHCLLHHKYRWKKRSFFKKILLIKFEDTKKPLISISKKWFAGLLICCVPCINTCKKNL